MTQKTPYQLRLELLQEARAILQAKAATPATMPSHEEIIKVARDLNDFISGHSLKNS